MGESSKFVFGTGIKRQVAKRIQTHVETKFAGNSAKAAASLGISRQRLFSYTSAIALPRPRVFDLILQKWDLDLLGRKAQRASETFKPVVGDKSQTAQRSLFESPVTLKGDRLKVLLKRRGPRLVASIEISTEVEVA